VIYTSKKPEGFFSSSRTDDLSEIGRDSGGGHPATGDRRTGHYPGRSLEEEHEITIRDMQHSGAGYISRSLIHIAPVGFEKDHSR